jgi:Phosphate-selective porin O and P
MTRRSRWRAPAPLLAAALAADAAPVAAAPPPSVDAAPVSFSVPVPPPPPVAADLADLPLVGDKDGLLYVRDARDLFRLHPHARVDLDAHGFSGARVDDLRPSEAGVDLAPRFFMRRVRFELGGEAFRRFGFNVDLDLTANPAIDGARADGTRTLVALADAWGSADAGHGLRLTAGVFQALFSLENRTATSDLAMTERNVAVRGFAVPGGRVLGASARLGRRNLRDAFEDAPAITTGQGFALWRSTRVDSQARTPHLIPSSTQWAAGGEARLPVGGFAVRGEAYWVSRNTVEAPDGLEAAAVERTGRLQGLAWYVEQPRRRAGQQRRPHSAGLGRLRNAVGQAAQRPPATAHGRPRFDALRRVAHALH